MKHFEKIVILCGGQSGEREVSLHSAEPVFEALKKMYPTQLLRLDVNVLPTELNPETDLIFPLIHGDFGEDGQLQALLEERNFTYVGSDAKASALCMDKIRSKHLAAENGISVLPAIELTIGQALDREMLEKTLKTTAFVLKPTDKGSSIGVHLCENFDALCVAWADVKEGHWMIEPYVRGRELTVGLLHGKAIGVGEIYGGSLRLFFPGAFGRGDCGTFAAFFGNILQSSRLSGFRSRGFHYGYRRKCLVFGNEHHPRHDDAKSVAEICRVHRNFV